MAHLRTFWLVLAVVMGALGAVASARAGDVPPPENVRGYYRFNSGFEAREGEPVRTTQVILFWQSPTGYSEVSITTHLEGQEPRETRVSGEIHSFGQEIYDIEATRIHYEIRGIVGSESSPPVTCVPEDGNIAEPEDVSCSYTPGTGTRITWKNPVAYDHLDIKRVIRDERGTRADSFPVEGTASEALDPRELSTTDLVYYEVRGWQLWNGERIYLVSQPARCWLIEKPHLPFIRGDVNRDGVVSISDVATLSNYLKGGPWPTCWSAADANDDGSVGSQDVIFMLFALYQTGGPVFPEPFSLGPAADDSGSFSCAEPVGPAPAQDDRFVIEVGSLEGRPGEVVTVPVFATTPVTIDAESLSLSYDASKVRLEGTSVAGTVLEPLPLPLIYLKNDTALGRAVIGIQNHLPNAAGNLPPLDRKVLLNLQVRILPEAAEGDTEITPENGLGNPPVWNEFSVLGDAVYAATLPVLKKGKIGIGTPGNIDFFTRGDPNADGLRDVSDPIALLSFLFTGGGNPSCERAADANDDGTLDVTDAVTMLGYLFLDAPVVLPPPFPACGGAPASGLSCEGGGCR
jgi:hypothetical protein